MAAENALVLNYAIFAAFQRLTPLTCPGAALFMPL
ncbi:MAG: hypothetical protein ACI95S_001957, partial [Dinoroseobacter sp.]